MGLLSGQQHIDEAQNRLVYSAERTLFHDRQQDVEIGQPDTAAWF